MPEFRIGAGIALGLLLFLMLYRIPNMIRHPESRLAWLASFTGCLALISVGVLPLLSLPVLDGWLGGTNLINLSQNVLATCAFWFLLQATLTLDESRFNPASTWALPGMIVPFAIPFFMIANRGPTDPNFIRSRVDDWALWAYAVLYMLSVTLIMTQILLGVRGRRPWQYHLIRIGAALIALGSLLEVIYLTLRVLDVQPRALIERLGDLFAPPFFGGVVAVTAGIMSFTFAKWTRAGAWWLLGRLLAGTRATHEIDVANLAQDDAAHESYRLAVRLTDLANSQTLLRRERFSLVIAAWILNRLMRAPAVVRLSIAPQDHPRLNGTS
ncbi:hypothetical protein ACIPY5_19955 [Microbacterium sp. NPDC089698]|uniref:hypothetical protein n=1 Tax=Microbacterium sp. NPDC089698 TaxID=3364200 RepID=UPI00382B4011